MSDSTGNANRVSQRREKQRKKSRIRLASAVLIGIVGLYLLAAVFSAFGGNLSTTVATRGEVEESVNCKGYVFRQQSVISAPGSGYLYCLVNDGERVREGQTIAYLYEVQPDAEILGQIKSLSDKIARLKGIDDEIPVYTGDSAMTEKRISESVRDLSDLRQGCDLNDAAQKKQELNVLIGRKGNSSEVKQNDEGDSSLEQLESRLSALKTRAGGHYEITAPSGGVFTPRIDGMEDSLAYDKALDVTPSYLAEIDKRDNVPAGNIEAGQPLCKIVNNYTWYFAAQMSDKEIENISEGQSVRLEFFDLTDTIVKGTVSKISAPENGKHAVIIRTNRYVDGIYATSRAEANVITVSAEGIKLPTACLRVKDGVTGVYIVRLDTAKFVPVNVKHKNDEFAIVSAAEAEIGGTALRMYDEVIVECRNLEDGKVVR